MVFFSASLCLAGDFSMNILWMDRFGSLASMACAAHCVVMAAIPSLFAVAEAGHHGHHGHDGEQALLEWAFFGVASVFAAGAAIVGYRSHRTWWIAAGFGLGLPVLAAGRLGEAFHIEGVGFGLTVLGGVILASSHLLSIRQCKRAQNSCCP
jgi:hypothetical protein